MATATTSTASVIAMNAEKLALLQAEQQALKTQLETERAYFENERVILQEQLQSAAVRQIYERPPLPLPDTQTGKPSRQGSAIPSYALRPPQSGGQRRSLNSANAKTLRDGEPPPPPGGLLGTPSRLGRVAEGQHGGAMTVVNLGTLPPGAASPAPPASSRGNRPSRTGNRRSVTSSVRSSRAPSRAGGTRTPLRALSRQGTAARMRPANVPLPINKAQYTKPSPTYPSEMHFVERSPAQHATAKPAAQIAAGGRIVRKGAEGLGKPRTEQTSLLWQTTKPPKHSATAPAVTAQADDSASTPKILSHDALSSAIAQRMALRREMARSQAEAAAASKAAARERRTKVLSKGGDSRPSSAGPRLSGKGFKEQAEEAKRMLETVEPLHQSGEEPASTPSTGGGETQGGAAAQEEPSDLPNGTAMPAHKQRPPPQLQHVPDTVANVSQEEMAARVAALPIPSLGGMRLHPASISLPDGGIYCASGTPANGHVDPRVRRRRARGYEPSRQTSDDGESSSRAGGADREHNAIIWHVRELPPLPTIPDDLDLSQMDPAEAEQSIMQLSKQLKDAIEEQRSAADEIITAEREELQELARIHRQRMEIELAELHAANMEIEEEEEAMGSMSESSLQIQLALEAMKRQMAEMQALQESMMERIAAGEEDGSSVDFTESMQEAVHNHEEKISEMLEQCDELDERIGGQGNGDHDLSASIVPADGIVYAEPTEEEVEEYAVYLGIDPSNDNDLLWIARQAITAPVPEGWERYLDGEGNEFYYNRAKHFSTYEHPLDDRFRGMVSMAKTQKAVALPPAASTTAAT